METASVKTFEQIQMGDVATRTVTLSDALVDAFADISGDRSPIHMHNDEARAAGFTQRVVHGALLGSFVSALIGMDLPGHNALLQKLDLSFHKPVYPGDTVTLRGEVTRKIESVQTLQIKIQIVSQSGDVAVRGVAQVGVIR